MVLKILQKGDVYKKTGELCLSEKYQRFCWEHVTIEMSIRHSMEGIKYATGCSCVELKGEVS